MSLMDSFNELEPKQKATLIVTLILMGFVVYLGYDTFYPEGFGGGNTPTTVTKAPPPPIYSKRHNYLQRQPRRV